MPNESRSIDTTFSALADPTRRAVVQALSDGPASVSELARPFAMALPSFTQHLGVLERAGLVTSTKQGRVRTYRIARKALEVVDTWLAEQRRHWEQKLDQLDALLLTMNTEPT